MTPTELSIAFFLQVAVILVTCRLVGTVAQRWLGQPRVVGEMIAGVILGPSLLGALAPEVQKFLFPPESKPILFVIAQFGVGLYMFLVGLGFDRDGFRNGARGAASVSLAGMAAPFAVAVAIAPWLLSYGGLFTPKVTQFEATLFMGAAIAITAFPMLARIIHERGLSGSPLGTLSLSAGAIDDAGAWVLIALVLASFGDGPQVAGSDARHKVDRVPDHHADPPGQNVRQGGRKPLIGNVSETKPSQLIDQFAGDVPGGAHSLRAKRHLVRV